MQHNFSKESSLEGAYNSSVSTETLQVVTLEAVTSDIKLFDMDKEIENIRTLKAAWEENQGSGEEKKHLQMYKKSKKELKKKLRDQPLLLPMNFNSEDSEKKCLPIAISTINFEVASQMVKQVQELYNNEKYEKDSPKYFVSGDIFYKADIQLTYLNGLPVPKNTPVLVPACSAQTQALIIALHRMSEQAILEGKKTLTILNVQIKKGFNSVQDFAQYMAINYSLDRGFRGKEKIKIVSMATHNEFMDKVQEVCEKYNMPQSTAIKYYTQGKLLNMKEWTQALQGKISSSIKYDLTVGDTIIETLKDKGLGALLHKRYLIDAISQLANTKLPKSTETYGNTKVIEALEKLTPDDIGNILGESGNICNIFSTIKSKITVENS